MLTHFNVTANVNQIFHPQFIDYTDTDCRLIGVVPFFHIYGMVVLLASGLHQGASNVILPRFEPELFLSTIQNYNISRALVVPPLALFLAKHPMVDSFNVSSIKEVFCGGAPLGVEIIMAVKQ